MRRLLVLLAALGLTAAGAPLAAVDKYVAMGDSITAGTSFPSACGICPVLFDCPAGGSGCDDSPQTNRDKCGFVGRIDSWLGAGNYVMNRGRGGEKTLSAVSRFVDEMDDECGTPGDCISVILMHGTNDMNGSVSPETARDNLAFMIDEAKTRNIDTLLMTIIRKGLAPTNSKWEDYRDLILDLAADKDLQSVDPWLTLCPNTSCYNANYWLAGEGPCFDPDADPDPGHLDPDGYDELTDLIKAVFPGSAPAAPVPTSPAGDISDTQPDFVWPEVATARWYELDVDGATTWWEAAAHCGGGTCTVDPGVGLAEGNHSWRVRGRNLRSLGGWSADTDFEIWAIPGTPVTSVPIGLHFDTTPLVAPYDWEPYTWSEVADATDYDLVVSDGGGPVLMQSFDSSICSASICKASPMSGLDADSYTWTVQARNPGASGPVSAALAFEIYDTTPGEPVPTGPSGDYFEPLAPLYEWLPAAGATDYDIEVKDLGGNVDASASALLASAVCTDDLCSYQGGTLADPDDYTLRVLARNVIGDNGFSTIGADFTILPCTDALERDLATLEPSPVTTTEVVVHCGPVIAAETAAYTIEASGDLSVHTREFFAAHDGFSVKGDLEVGSD